MTVSTRVPSAPVSMAMPGKAVMAMMNQTAAGRRRPVAADAATPAEAARAARAPLFAGLDADTVGMILENADTLDGLRGRTLFLEGDPADALHVLIEGRVHLLLTDESGEESVIDILEPTTSFMESAIFDLGRYPVSAWAAPRSRLVRIPASALTAALDSSRGFALAVMAAQSRWNRRLVQELFSAKAVPPPQRLARYLLSLVTAAGGTVRVELPLTKRLIASRIGVVPETLSRIMRDLRTLGIESDGNTIIIHDVEALRRYGERNDLIMRGCRRPR